MNLQTPVDVIGLIGKVDRELAENNSFSLVPLPLNHPMSAVRRISELNYIERLPDARRKDFADRR